MPRVYLAAYGCQMNVLDADRVRDLLASEGWEASGDPEAADLYLINTCSVREHAEQRASALAGGLKRWKASRRGRRIGVLGCMAQREQGELFGRLPHVDFLCGPENYPALPEMLGRLADPAVTHLAALEQHGEVLEIGAERLPADGRGAFQAFVAVSQGCDRTCTFCVVPKTRGQEKSRSPEALLTEVRQLSAAGVSEITFLGQTVNSYRWEGTDLGDLLRSAAGVEGIRRVRTITHHPAHMTERLISAFSEGGPICPSLPMPLQSGSDRVLAAMRRGYTVERYLRLVDRLREKVPDLELTSDFIVGYPGETQEDFEATLHQVRTIGFLNIFAFKYSPRPGTEAFPLPDDVPQVEKERRHRLLLEAQAETARARNQSQLGRVVEVLAEGPSKRDASRLTGRDRAGRLIHFPGDASQAGSFVDVRIDRATGLSFSGFVPAETKES